MARPDAPAEVYRSGPAYLVARGPIATFLAGDGSPPTPPGAVATVQAHAHVAHPWAAVGEADWPEPVRLAARSLAAAPWPPDDY